MGLLENVYVAAAGMVTVMVLAWIAGLLLGLRISLPRAVLAGLFGMATGGVLAQALWPPGEVPAEIDWPYGTIVTGTTVLGAMAFLVAAEVLVPRGTRLRPVARVRGLGAMAGRTRRYLQILHIVFRHGLGPYLWGRRDPSDLAQGRRRLARSLGRALERGGVTFVKLGQVLATRRDLLSPVFIEELGRLHHQVTPVPWEQLEPLVAEELGAPVEEFFAEFDRAPLASASIAQVYRARLRTGEQVVVKVQRPGIGPVVRRDLDIVRRLAGTLHRRTGWGPALGVLDLAEGFAEALLEELDFRTEAANMAAVAAAASGRVRVPRVHDDLCTARVLVMERLDGTPLSDERAVRDLTGEARAELATTLLDFVLDQVLLHGVFHADPHPGNIFVLADGRPGLLDYGSVGRLDAALRAALQRVLLAVDRGDPTGLTDGLLDLSPLPDEVDERRLRRALGQFMVRYLNGGAGADVKMFTDLLLLVSRHGLAMPPEIAAVLRALATLEGALSLLAPGFDLVAEARRFAAERVGGQVGPAALRQTATEELVNLLPTLRRLPRRWDRISAALESGRLSVAVRPLADEDDRRFLAGLVNQSLLTLIAIAAGVSGVLLLGTTGGPALAPDLTLFQAMGYNLMVVGCLLVLRVLLVIYRRR
ncbi:ABC1 kinase family protein [Allonocardiopsis opalescens]|uniref:Ubiquinone biosynthesis protein n=1 Tax=Allonocardiopsis opalescens TaxID=1144618 RepID=A0A2T0Q513_9ACTN|nr:AarF/UbiB family protein [Allonocardiopsis opalescens]PRX98849.1 ubiquinone biosynthesis protein [Allonocardiopsis opalescens]